MKLDKAWRVDLTDQLNQGLCGCLRVNEIGIDRTFPNVPIIEAKVAQEQWDDFCDSIERLLKIIWREKRTSRRVFIVHTLISLAMAAFFFVITTIVDWPHLVMIIVGCLNGGQYLTFQLLQIVSTRRNIKSLRNELHQLCADRNEDNLFGEINFEIKSKTEPQCCRSVIFFRFKRIHFIEIKTVDFDEEQSLVVPRDLDIHDQNSQGAGFTPSIETGASGPSTRGAVDSDISLNSHQPRHRSNKKRYDDSLSPVTMNKDSPHSVEAVSQFQEYQKKKSYRNESDERSRGSNSKRKQSSRNEFEPVVNSQIGSHGDVPSQIVADPIEEEQHSKVTEVIDDNTAENLEPVHDEEEEENHDSDIAVEGGSLNGDESEKNEESVTSDSKLKSSETSSNINWNVAKMRVDNVKRDDDDAESSTSDVAAILRNATNAGGGSISTTAIERDGVEIDRVMNAEAIVFGDKEEDNGVGRTVFIVKRNMKP